MNRRSDITPLSVLLARVDAARDGVAAADTVASGFPSLDKMVGGEFIPAYTDTVLRVWPNVQVLADGDTWSSSAPSTYVVGAGDQAVAPERLAGVRAQGPNGTIATRIMPGDLMHQWLDDAQAPVLSDDYAPVDNLIAPIFAERGF